MSAIHSGRDHVWSNFVLADLVNAVVSGIVSREAQQLPCFRKKSLNFFQDFLILSNNNNTYHNNNYYYNNNGKALTAAPDAANTRVS